MDSFIRHTLPHKIVTASLAGTFYTLGFCLVYINPFGLLMNSWEDYAWQFVTAVPFFMPYILSIMMTYGVVTSLMSDFIARILTGGEEKRGKKIVNVISGVLHFLFGWIFKWPSLFASVLFFVLDRSLVRKRQLSWGTAGLSLLVPLSVWLLFMCMVWIKG